MPRRRVALSAIWGVGTPGQTKRPLSEASSDRGRTLREVNSFRSETGRPPGEAAYAEKEMDLREAWESSEISGEFGCRPMRAASGRVRNRSAERGSLATVEAANVRL